MEFILGGVFFFKEDKNHEKKNTKIKPHEQVWLCLTLEITIFFFKEHHKGKLSHNHQYNSNLSIYFKEQSKETKHSNLPTDFRGTTKTSDFIITHVSD